MSSRYDQLAGRVDSFNSRVKQRYPGALTCHVGCSQCCHQHLSVYSFEFERIQTAVDGLPVASKEALRERLSAGTSDPRCPLLDGDGQCRVYEARPMICRSHGLPISVGEPAKRDVCPLNFTSGPTADELPDEDVLNVNSVNAILAVFDHVESGGQGERIELIAGLQQHLGES